MFTDLVGSTQLAQRDEKGALRLLDEQDALARPIFEAHHGRLVKSLGDGMLVEFPNAREAVECAVEFQRSFHERNSTSDPASPQVRIGVHVGDVEERGTDILGDAVNVAARIEPLAPPGGVYLSAVVYEHVRHKVPYAFEKVGPRDLKGVLEPVEIYRVVLPWAASPRSSTVRGPARLAVLPFSNISPDPNDAYFADGLTEELITALSLIRGLRVISRTSVAQYRGVTKPIAQIGAELGVGSILEGSVRKAGNRLRITVQLIDVATDEHRWSQSYDRQLDDVFAIQAEVADRTAGALRLELGAVARATIAEEGTDNLAAYEAYLRGSEETRHLPAQMHSQRAEEYLEEAVRLDPGFAAAHARLATFLVLISGMTRAGREVYPRARLHAARALELNPHLAEGHVAIGNVAMQADLDWGTAELEFRKALELNPSSSDAHSWLAQLLSALQRFSEADLEAQAAVDTDPRALLPHLVLFGVAFHQGELGVASDRLERIAGLFPGLDEVDLLRAGLHVRRGKVDDAVRVLDRFRDHPNPLLLGERAFTLAVGGRTEELRTLLAAVTANGTAFDYIGPLRLAEAHLVLGETDEAWPLLERDAQEGGDHGLWAHYQSPVYDPIRNDPRFVALLRSMNLPTTLTRRIRGKGDPAST